MGRYLLAIDQGTTGSTALIIDHDLAIIGKQTVDFQQHFPQPGWVEHNPREIWESIRAAVTAVLEETTVAPADIAAIGITNQRETSLMWDKKTGIPSANAIVWQCRRTSDFCQELKAKGLEELFRARTGLVLDPYFSGTKVRWLLDNVDGLRTRAEAGEIAFGTIDTFLVWRLSSGNAHVTDVSNASRTSLMNLKTRRWDKQLLDLFEVPIDILPQIVPSSGVLGHTSNVPGLPDGIPIAGVAGDQQAALFGQTCFNQGEAKCTFGTGSFILMNTGADLLESGSGLLTTVAWQLGDKGKPVYALEGGAFVCGAAVQWLRDGLQIIKRAPEIEALANTVSDHGGVEFVPALTGLGAPHWAPEARGTLTGLTRGAEQGHIARATLDAMALQNADILRAMEADLGKRMKPLRVDGGAAANDLLMQIQADVLGRKLIRPQVIETTVAGACYLAGLGIGLWQGTGEVRSIWQAEREFAVSMSTSARRKRQLSWNNALQRTLL